VPVSPSATALAKKPIAVIINRMTVSMGEIAADFFSGFEKSVTIGETSYGAFGSWNDDSSVPSGCFKVGNYIKVTNPYEQTYLSDGKNYEGKGINPDIPLAYDYDQFLAGTDGRLLKAFQYVRDHQ
jgi:C-terminal processing protease CtpA/Prc